jgi:hypothetical protein
MKMKVFVLSSGTEDWEGKISEINDFLQSGIQVKHIAQSTGMCMAPELFQGGKASGVEMPFTTTHLSIFYEEE